MAFGDPAPGRGIRIAAVASMGASWIAPFLAMRIPTGNPFTIHPLGWAGMLVPALLTCMFVGVGLKRAFWEGLILVLCVPVAFASPWFFHDTQVRCSPDPAACAS